MGVESFYFFRLGRKGTVSRNIISFYRVSVYWNIRIFCRSFRFQNFFNIRAKKFHFQKYNNFFGWPRGAEKRAVLFWENIKNFDNFRVRKEYKEFKEFKEFLLERIFFPFWEDLGWKVHQVALTYTIIFLLFMILHKCTIESAFSEVS